jgi:hypothetical protein
MAFAIYNGQLTRLGCHLSRLIGAIQFLLFLLHRVADGMDLGSRVDNNSGKSPHIPAKSTSGCWAVSGAHSEERWMIAAHVGDAMKSSGNANESTGTANLRLHRCMSMLCVNGESGWRANDRRDSRAWKRGIRGIAEHWRERRRFFPDYRE